MKKKKEIRKESHCRWLPIAGKILDELRRTSFTRLSVGSRIFNAGMTMSMFLVNLKRCHPGLDPGSMTPLYPRSYSGRFFGQKKTPVTKPGQTMKIQKRRFNNWLNYWLFLTV